MACCGAVQISFAGGNGDIGDSGMGMTHGTIPGILLPDLILGHRNPWAELYDPARKTRFSRPVSLNSQLRLQKLSNSRIGFRRQVAADNFFRLRGIHIQ